MTLSTIHIGEAADLVYAAQAGRAPIGPLTERYPGLGVADAYAIQQVNLSGGCVMGAHWSRTRLA